jgi:hypothetical protein
MAWDGTERRINPSRIFCEGHIELSNTVCRIEERLISVDKRINGSINAIEKHIEHGSKWRLSIVGVAGGLVLAIIGGVYTYAQVAKQVEINTIKWQRLDEMNTKYINDLKEYSYGYQDHLDAEKKR